jgi:hypothetical protein
MEPPQRAQSTPPALFPPSPSLPFLPLLPFPPLLPYFNVQTTPIADALAVSHRNRKDRAYRIEDGCQRPLRACR